MNGHCCRQAREQAVFAIPSYDRISGGFREDLSRLAPRNAYSKLHDVSRLLAEHIDAGSVAAKFPTSRDSVAVKWLNPANEAYARNDAVYARRAVEALISGGRLNSDPRSLADALHLLGRLEFDDGHQDKAEEAFKQVLQICQQAEYVAGFVRAAHELSRVKAKAYALLEAEAGFRLAADFYALCCVANGRSSEDFATDGPHQRNMVAALGCLSVVAENYLEAANGPKEGDRIIKCLGSDAVNLREGSGDDFLTIRGLSLQTLISADPRQAASNLTAFALSLLETRKKMCVYALEEASWHGERRQIHYPSTLSSIIARADQHPLRAEPSFKPGIHSVEANAALRHITIEDAADSVESLYDYLINFDRDERFVYRGQTQEYDAPLLPSAFRPILKGVHGVATRRVAETDKARRLRGCGTSFVGDYNYCFSRYADVMHPQRTAGTDQSEIEHVFSVYNELLKDPFLTLGQDNDEVLPWADIVANTLAPDALSIYRAHAADWDLRIDSFHKRRFRDELLVQMWGYTLGTTFAQQFGLSSEGLDATKSLDVACFFATRDSADFLRVPEDGIGVIYRFPFPVNMVAKQPLSAFTFYNLPSIVDVEDVFYRFEYSELDEADAMSCILAYLSARLTYGAQSSDLLFVPAGFIASSRVRAQEAVIILPDEIREDLLDREPGIGGIRFPKFRYIEDLKTRPGMTRFYFKHSGRGLNHQNSPTREQLWPRDDFLLRSLILMLAGSYRMRQAIPKRLDLIDGGYDRDAFLRYLRELYSRYRHAFVTPHENMGRRNGAITI